MFASMDSLSPTYELQIDLLEVGGERRYNVTMPNATNTTYLERREKAYTINALMRIQKYHKRRDLEGSYIGIS